MKIQQFTPQHLFARLTYKTRPFFRVTLGLLFTLALTTVSCKKFISLDPPYTQLSAKAVYESELTARAALSAAYLNSFTFANGGFNSVTYTGLLSADETDNYSVNLSSQQLSANQLIASNSYTTAIWQSGYSTIYQCTAVIEGLKDNPNIPAATAKQLTGEALFLRALSHMSLVSLYGPVPIVTSTDYRVNTRLARSSETAVLSSIIADLLEAKTLLPADYAPYSGERLRASKWAAVALLSRAYLYQGELEKAISSASEVIAHTVLFSLTPLTEVFLKNSKESIFQLKNTSTSINTNEGNLLTPTTRPINAMLRKSFYDSFEAGDQRRTAWIGAPTFSGTQYYHAAKYKTKTSTTYLEYSSVLRLAEQYLIRAEAYARNNQLAPALMDLDALRTRALLPKLAPISPSASKEAVLERVLQERKAELFTEWAHRWIDLRRFGKADALLSPLKPGWKSSATLFPIPFTDILVNANLTQNPGY